MRKITLLMMAMAAMSALAGTCRWTGAGGATTIDFNGVHAISNLITTGTSHLTLAGLAVRHGPCLHGHGHHAPFPLIPSKKGSHNDNDLPKV